MRFQILGIPTQKVVENTLAESSEFRTPLVRLSSGFLGAPGYHWRPQVIIPGYHVFLPLGLWRPAAGEIFFLRVSFFVTKLWKNVLGARKLRYHLAPQGLSAGPPQAKLFFLGYHFG